MPYYKTPIAAGFAALASLLVAASVSAGEVSRDDYADMNPEELANYLIFEAKGFHLDQKTQEGATVRDRLTQDELQKKCSKEESGGSIDSETLNEVRKMAQESIEYPEGGIKLGDWKEGEKIAKSGYGYRVGHKVDDHSKRPPGGNCYACHEMSPDVMAFGTLGPSLKAYGKNRGTGEAMKKYTYKAIYNPHTTFPCTQMPRFGANGVLTQEQIADVMAYLMDPESPVNQ